MIDVANTCISDLSLNEVAEISGGFPLLILAGAGAAILVCAAIDYAVDGQLMG